MSLGPVVQGVSKTPPDADSEREHRRSESTVAHPLAGTSAAVGKEEVAEVAEGSSSSFSPGALPPSPTKVPGGWQEIRGLRE